MPPFSHRSCLALTALLLTGCADPAPTPPAPPPATRPVTRPTTEPVADAARPLAEYVDVLLADDPDFPTTRPLALPLAIAESARLVFDEPVLLDAVGRLWVTHPDGETPQQIVAGDLKRQTYVVDRPVHFTWWKPDHDGKPYVEMILGDGAGEGAGGLVWTHELGVAAVPAAPPGHPYQWDGAFAYDGAVVVPTLGGVAVLTPRGRPDPEQYFRRYARLDADRRPEAAGTVELQHVSLAEPRDDLPATQVRLDGRGLLAWVPWESKKRPGGGVARYVDGQWQRLDPPTWAERPVQLMPLTDGSVLQLALDQRGEGVLTAVPLDAKPVDADAVARHVDDLSDGDPKVREAAFAALANYGPSVWPTLDALRRGKPAFVRRQIDALLGDKTRPTLGGLSPEPGQVEVRDRLADGGVILNFKGGVLLPDAAGITVLQRPAYLVVRPGKRTQLLDPLIAADVEADPGTRVYVWGDEWVVCRPGESPKRWLVNHTEPLTGKKWAHWQRFVGIDAAGRWLFHQGEGGEVPAREPTTRPTLVLDVRLPDPTPRLPTWLLPVGGGGSAGWDDEGWPVIKSGGVWRLKEEVWEPRPDDATIRNATTQPAEEGLLATGPDGATYFGGITEVRVRATDGRERTWPLPPEATGSGVARGVVDAEGRLFLFNRPGRVVRLDPPKDASGEPFEVAGVFDKPQLPSATPRRVWIDPAGRLCALYFDDAVAVMWPGGRVPGAMREKMPVDPTEGVPGGGGGLDPRQGI